MSETDACKTEGRDTVDMYKVVAIVIGSKRAHSGPRNRSSRLLSIYDGITEYTMHQWCEAPADSPGYFVHKSKADALRTGFPRGSKLLKTQRCLLRCRVRSTMSNRLKSMAILY